MEADVSAPLFAMSDGRPSHRMRMVPVYPFASPRESRGEEAAVMALENVVAETRELSLFES